MPNPRKVWATDTGRIYESHPHELLHEQIVLRAYTDLHARTAAARSLLSPSTMLGRMGSLPTKRAWVEAGLPAEDYDTIFAHPTPDLLRWAFQQGWVRGDIDDGMKILTIYASYHPTSAQTALKAYKEWCKDEYPPDFVDEAYNNATVVTDELAPPRWNAVRYNEVSYRKWLRSPPQVFYEGQTDMSTSILDVWAHTHRAPYTIIFLYNPSTGDFIYRYSRAKRRVEHSALLSRWAKKGKLPPNSVERIVRGYYIPTDNVLYVHGFFVGGVTREVPERIVYDICRKLGLRDDPRVIHVEHRTGSLLRRIEEALHEGFAARLRDWYARRKEKRRNRAALAAHLATKAEKMRKSKYPRKLKLPPHKGVDVVA